MDYKEKYEQAINFIKDLYPHTSDYVKEKLDDFFPELKESEDERVSKEIISAIKEDWPGHTDWIAWLEKQGEQEAWTEEDKKMLKWVIGYLENKMLNAPMGEERTACKNAIVWFEKLKDEQKSVDKVEPKFKVGDLIKYDKDGEVNRVVEITSDGYKLEYSSHILCFSSQDNWELVEDSVSEDEKVRKEIIAHIKWCEDSGYCAKEEMTRWITFLENQGKPIDKIVKRAMTEKQRVLLTETNGDANIDWDTRSLKDAITLLKHGLNYLQEIEVKKQTMPSSRFGGCSEYIPTRFDKEKQGKQDEQNLPSFDESQGTPILKQGEQKPADKIEPKFHKGEWITHNTANFVFKIISFGYNGYEVVNRENYKKTISSGNEDNYHLWTIEDAKNGDVLADKYNNIGIFSRCEGICWHSYIYLGCDGELRGFSIGGRHEQIDTHPATKEQRDALMKAMADAGYTFDFEKKELKRIEQKPAAWSEEDDQYLLVCKNALAKYQVSDKWDATIISRWLENKLKASQNRWKPSDEQVKALEWQVNNTSEGSWQYEESKNLLKQIKKLREE